jgi:predicted acyl esterase
VILTYSPYNTLSEYMTPNLANDDIGQRYVPKGYARAVADVLGTRNSSGCWGYGDANEQQSGVDLVNFLAAQPWTNGKVAMIGGSYDGTTATMVAARGADVPGLAAIVPIAGISRWYGYAYGDGVRYFLNSERPTDEGIDTPLAFDFGLTRTPPTDPTDPLYAEKLASRANPCEAADHTVKGYDRTPDYDAFWLERDYRKDAANIRAAALVAHGWQDYNVKQEEGVDLYRALTSTPLKRLYMWQAGPFRHANEHRLPQRGRLAAAGHDGNDAEARRRLLYGYGQHHRGAVDAHARSRDELAVLRGPAARHRHAHDRVGTAQAHALGGPRPRPPDATARRRRAGWNDEDRFTRFPEPAVPQRPGDR